MKDRRMLIVLTAFVMTASPLLVLAEEAPAEQPAAEAAAPAAQAPAEQSQAPANESDLMTEAELANVLVNVLGLAAMLPPNPQQSDVFGILLQNRISPKDGWNATNYVSMATLARIMVQSMGEADQIENPDDDGAWVKYLKSKGVDFATVEDGIDQLDPMPDPVALAAVETSTDPLRKVPAIRPADEQQLGADLQTFRRLLSKEDINRIFLEPQPPTPPTPPRTTPS